MENTHSTKDISITSFGAASDVGKSCFLIESDGRKILLDAGLQLNPRRTKLPSKGPIGVDNIAHELTAVILSHAHMDHSGYIPALYELGYEGPIYCTKPTAPITKLLWQDHLKIEGDYHYTKESYFRASKSFKKFNYDSSTKVADGVQTTFIDAGHILGSASVLVDIDGTLIYYSGDINEQVSPFHLPAETPDEPVDVLLVEATNGSRVLPKRRKVTKGLIQTIKEKLHKGKKVIIPSFALGRGQEMQMYLIKHLGASLLSKPLYVDGMINKMNSIYEHYLNSSWISEYAINQIRDLSLDSPFEFDGIKKISKETISMNINEYRTKLIQSRKPKIILSTSGMLEGGPILSYLADQNASGNLLAIVGYQVQGTIGYDIMNGQSKFSLETPWGKMQKLNLQNQVERFYYSGHASQQGIKEFILDSKPEMVFTIHSDYKNHLDLQKVMEKDNLVLNRFEIDKKMYINN